MASPIRWFRKHSQIFIVFFGVILMAIFGLGSVIQSLDPSSISSGGKSENPVIAEWDGGQLTSNDLQTMRQSHFAAQNLLSNVYRIAIENNGGKPFRLTAQQINGLGWRSRSASPTVSDLNDDMIYRFLKAERAKKEGFVVDDEMVYQYIYQYAGENGISRDELKRINREVNNRVTLPRIVRQLKLELLHQQMEIMDEAGSAFSPAAPFAANAISPAEAMELYARTNQKIEGQVLPIPVADYLDQTGEPSDQELRELYNEGRYQFGSPNFEEPGFKQPRRVKVQSFIASMDTFIENEIQKLTDEQVQAEYERLIADDDNLVMQLVPVEEEADENDASEEAQEPAKDDDPAPAPNGDDDPAPAPETDAKEGEENTDEPAESEKPESEKQPRESESTDEKEAESTPKEDGAATESDAKEDSDVDTEADASEDSDSDPVTDDEEVSGEEGGEETDEAAEETDSDNDDSTDEDEPDSDQDDGSEPVDAAIGSAYISITLQETTEETAESDQSVATQEQTENSAGDTTDESTGDAGDAVEGETPPAAQEDESAAENTEDAQSTDAQPDNDVQSNGESQTEGESNSTAGEPNTSESTQSIKGATDPVISDEKTKREPKPLIEVADQIKRRMVSQDARKARDAAVDALEKELIKFQSDYSKWEYENADKKDEELPPPAAPDFQALADQHGVQYTETGLVNRNSIADEKIGKAFRFEFSQNRQPRQIFIGEDIFLNYESTNLYQHSVVDDFSAKYVYWLSEKKDRYIAEFDEVKDQIVEFWKHNRAVELATERANSIADEINGSGKQLSEEFADQSKPTGSFQWFTSFGRFSFGAPQGIENPGDKFMKMAFALEKDKAGTAINQSRDFVYVFQAFAAAAPTLAELGEQYIEKNFFLTERIPEPVVTAKSIYYGRANGLKNQEFTKSIDLKINDQ